MKNHLKRFTLLLCICIMGGQAFSQIDSVYIDYDSCVVNRIQSNEPNTTFAHSLEFAALTWICDSAFCVTRTMMNLPLEQLPANAHILHAFMNLYPDTNSLLGFYNYPTYGIDNRGKIRRVTEYWNSQNVSWNTQPQTTKINQAFLPSSLSNT